MVKKAIITAAGKGTRLYPGTNAVQKELFPLVDLDGIAKPTIQIIAEQVLAAGIEEIAIVVQPGEEIAFQTHFQGLTESAKQSFTNKRWGLKQSDTLDRLKQKITYIHQTHQEGYGHAVHCAKEWVGDEPVLLMLGDHVYISHLESSCVHQILSGFAKYQQSIYAVKRTPADRLYLFGTVTGTLVDKDPGAYQLTKITEKPDVTYARQHLETPGLPEGWYLTFFGLHVLTPMIFTILTEHIEKNIRDKGEIQLTTAQAELCEREGAVGLEIQGDRLDMGTPLGYLETIFALANHGAFSREIQFLLQKATSPQKEPN
jgi:UTP--glucose-1-phosphate uridylyltransferase